jgi:hypothetical protein
LQVIHFTAGATDPLTEPHVQGARFVQLARGSGAAQLGCLHLAAGGSLPRRSMPHDSALMTVHGTISVIADDGLRLDICSGVGVTLNAGEYFSLESESGGVMVLFQCQRLEALESGISSPERIRGQDWPGDATSTTQDCAPSHGVPQ